jgi:hypothetical protein
VSDPAGTLTQSSEIALLNGVGLLETVTTCSMYLARQITFFTDSRSKTILLGLFDCPEEDGRRCQTLRCMSTNRQISVSWGPYVSFQTRVMPQGNREKMENYKYHHAEFPMLPFEGP